MLFKKYDAGRLGSIYLFDGYIVSLIEKGVVLQRFIAGGAYFQLSTQGMMKELVKTNPNKFVDLINNITKDEEYKQIAEIVYNNAVSEGILPPNYIEESKKLKEFHSKLDRQIHVNNFNYIDVKNGIVTCVTFGSDEFDNQNTNFKSELSRFFKLLSKEAPEMFMCIYKVIKEDKVAFPIMEEIRSDLVNIFITD